MRPRKKKDIKRILIVVWLAVIGLMVLSYCSSPKAPQAPKGLSVMSEAK